MANNPLALLAIGESTQAMTAKFLSDTNHLTVRKKFSETTERLLGSARHVNSRLFPPAPLTGDVGRDCGDASRALLFCLATSD
jgi:hypothetical protein